MSIDQVHKSIYRIRITFGQGVAGYLYLLKGDSLALVDTGTPESPARFIGPALGEIGLSISDLDLILNTHVHPDHSGGNAETKRISRAPIYLHTGDLPRAQSSETNVEFAIAPLRALDFPPEAVRQRAEYTRALEGEAVGADVVLSDGDEVELGGGIKMRVVHTPGHTPGSISYYWESEGVLLTGDSVQGRSGEPGSYPFYFDAPAYRRSMATLAQLDLRMLCMSHPYEGGGPVNAPVREGAECRALVQESIRVADTIHRAVEDTVKRMPGASRREMALDALSELAYHIPQLLVRETRMPKFAGPTLLSHIEAALAGTYPAM